MDYFEVDFSGFGWRELIEVAKLLTDYTNNNVTLNCDRHFSGSPLKIGVNLNSGNVFLLDDDLSVAMGSPLDIFLSLPYSGEEGFPKDFEGTNQDDYNPDDVEYLENYGSFDEFGVYTENKFKVKK